MSFLKAGFISIVLILVLLLTACGSTTPAVTTTAQDDTSEQAPNMQEASQANVQLGIGYLRQGNIARAKEKLLLASKQDPNSTAVWNAMAIFMQTTGNNAAAVKAYQKSLSIDPHSGETLNNYGVFLCQEKQPAAAVSYFQKAINDPNYVNTAQAYENAGLCSLDIPNKTQAADFFNKALQNDPTLSTSTFELAQLAYDKHDNVSAQFYLNRYNQLAKPSADSLLLTARLAKQANNSVLASNAAAELAAKFPNSSQYQQYLKDGTTS